MIRRVTILCLAALSLSAGSLAAQTPAAEPPPKKTTLIDSLKKAIDGNKDKVSDETRQKAEAAARAAMEALPDDLKKKAQDLATGSKAAEIRQKAVQTVQGAMQSRETPPATPAVTETVAVASPAACSRLWRNRWPNAKKPSRLSLMRMKNSRPKRNDSMPFPALVSPRRR